MKIIKAELFKRLQKTHGKSYQAFMLEKLVPVAGNVCESDIGLEEGVAEKMAKEVDVIVNSAANTTFDERSWSTFPSWNFFSAPFETVNHIYRYVNI